MAQDKRKKLQEANCRNEGNKRKVTERNTNKKNIIGRDKQNEYDSYNYCGTKRSL